MEIIRSSLGDLREVFCIILSSVVIVSGAWVAPLGKQRICEDLALSSYFCHDMRHSCYSLSTNEALKGIMFIKPTSMLRVKKRVFPRSSFAI